MRPAVAFLLGGILYFTCLKISLGELRAAMRPAVLARVAMLAPFTNFEGFFLNWPEQSLQQKK